MKHLRTFSGKASTGQPVSFTVDFNGSPNPTASGVGVGVKATYSQNVYTIDVTPPAPTAQTSVQFINNTGTPMSVPASSVVATPLSSNSCVSCGGGASCLISGSNCNVMYAGTFAPNSSVEFILGSNNFTVNFDGASSAVTTMSGVNATIIGAANAYTITVNSIVTVPVVATFTGSLSELLFNTLLVNQYKNLQWMGRAPIVLNATLVTSEGTAILKSVPTQPGFSPETQNLIALDSAASSFNGQPLSGEINIEYTNERVKPIILIISSVSNGSGKSSFILDPNLKGTATTVELVGTMGMKGAPVTITESAPTLELAAYYSFVMTSPGVTSALTNNIGTVSNSAFSFTFILPTTGLNNPISATGTISIKDGVSNNVISFTFNNWKIGASPASTIVASIYGSDITATVTSAELNLNGDPDNSYPTLTISGSVNGKIPVLYYNKNISGKINLTFED